MVRMKQVNQPHVQMRSPIHSGGSTADIRKNPKEDSVQCRRLRTLGFQGAETSDSQAKPRGGLDTETLGLDCPLQWQPDCQEGNLGE